MRLDISRKVRMRTTVVVEIDDVLASNLRHYSPQVAGKVLRYEIMPGLRDLTWTRDDGGLPEYELDAIYPIIEAAHVYSPDGNLRATPAKTERLRSVWRAAYRSGGEWITVERQGQPERWDTADDAIQAASRAKAAH